MGMTKGMTDLELTLYHGNIQDVPTANPDELRRVFFDSTRVRVRGVGNQFQKTTADSYKSDREMTVCEMQAAQDRAGRDHADARREFEKRLAALKKAKAKLSTDVLDTDTSEPWDIGLGRLYCNALALLKPKEAKAQSVQGAAATLPPPTSRGLTPATPNPNNTATQGPPPNSSDLAAIEVLRIRLQDTATLMNSYGVEIHKKFALAVACFVFVLLGAPIALRFPRGGVGLTIGVSLFVFALYYVCLIAGESIAKRGLMPAVVSMWMANVIFSLVALWMLMKMGQEGTTARGGDMREMIGTIKGSIRAKFAWKKRREARARLAA
jgi:lipopolysaccharide export system permease protein